MKIDLHIHSRTGSDGALAIEDVLREAAKRNITLMSVTDHDSVDGQERAIALAQEFGIAYVTGVELNVTFPLSEDASVSLDFLGYGYDIGNTELRGKLRLMAEHREERARRILDNLNAEFAGEGIERLTEDDMQRIRDSVDGTFGRPHIADYLVGKGIVRDRQEAFDRYLVRCDVPKYPLSLEEASGLIRGAGGVLVLAHPNDPNGTSLAKTAPDLKRQTGIIRERMLEYVDGVECWHSRHSPATVKHYVDFARKQGLIATGGSDCHQKPIIMGTLDIPAWVAGQFEAMSGRRV